MRVSGAPDIADCDVQSGRYSLFASSSRQPSIKPASPPERSGTNGFASRLHKRLTRKHAAWLTQLSRPGQLHQIMVQFVIVRRGVDAGPLCKPAQFFDGQAGADHQAMKARLDFP